MCCNDNAPILTHFSLKTAKQLNNIHCDLYRFTGSPICKTLWHTYRVRISKPLWETEGTETGEFAARGGSWARDQNEGGACGMTADPPRSLWPSGFYKHLHIPDLVFKRSVIIHIVSSGGSAMLIKCSFSLYDLSVKSGLKWKNCAPSPLFFLA